MRKSDLKLHPKILVNLTNSLLSERSQTQKSICNILFKYITKTENVYLYCQDSG